MEIIETTEKPIAITEQNIKKLKANDFKYLKLKTECIFCNHSEPTDFFQLTCKIKSPKESQNGQDCQFFQTDKMGFINMCIEQKKHFCIKTKKGIESNIVPPGPKA